MRLSLDNDAIVNRSASKSLDVPHNRIPNASSDHPQRPLRQLKTIARLSPVFKLIREPLDTGGRSRSTHQPPPAEPNDITDAGTFIPVSPRVSFFPGPGDMPDTICELCGISITYCAHARVSDL
jgi:hypothetical protein